MNSIAKATIIVPLVIIITAVLLRFSGSTYQSSTSDTTPISAIPTAAQQVSTPSLDVKKTITNELSHNSFKKLNLKGPLSCTYTDTESDTKLFILDRNIYAKFKSEAGTDYFLLNGDCGYKWTDGDKQGIKICNVRQYLSLFETFSSLPFFSPDMMLSFLPQIEGEASESFSRDNIARVIQSCTEQTIDDSLFDIPRGIQFVEQKISGTPEDFLKQ